MRTAIVSIVMALGCMPACSGDGKVDADNTKVNERDRGGAAPTPMDQGNSAADLDMTQKLRQALVGDDSLSSNARNLKIITKDGAVTVRGPVKDEAEKTRVSELLKNAAGAAPLDIQIDPETR